MDKTIGFRSVMLNSMDLVQNLVPEAGLTSRLIAVIEGDGDLMWLLLYGYGLAAGEADILQPFAAEFYFGKKKYWLYDLAMNFS